jgi:membrane-associated protease RseP (regulator of RpoE activity)
MAWTMAKCLAFLILLAIVPGEKAFVQDAQIPSGGARAWLGVHIQSVTPNVSNSTATGPTQGAVVVDKPDPRSPAAAAEIEIGDVITAINGQSVTGASYLSQRSAAMAGTSLPLTILRNGKPRTLWIVPSKVPDHEPAANSTPQPATNLTQPAASSTSAYADANAAINRQDYAAALHIVQPLADQGEAKFQVLLGLMYSEGMGRIAELRRVHKMVSSRRLTRGM